MFIGNINFSRIFNKPETTAMLLEKEHLFQESSEHPIHYPHYPYALEEQLYQAIIDGDTEKIERIGYEYSTYPSSVLCQNNSIRSLKNYLICNCALITRIAIRSGVDEKYAYFLSDLYINKIESLTTEETHLNLNAMMILDFMTQIKSRVASNTSHYSALTKKVIGYITENLYTHFTLTDVAAYVKANSSYLSRTFKQDVGISFTQYIHTNRVKKAQHLLLFSDLSLVEISAQLGYATQSHFNKIFKQMTGMTPKQFQHNHIGTKT